MEYFLSLVSGGVGGGALVWLAKGWISERLRQSIQHEYAQKLESYKTELNSKVEGIRHENQVSQLRTSLFFDHQRSAFAALIAKIAKNNEEWAELGDPDEGLFEPIPSAGRQEFEALILEHQLFLDEECLMALSLVTQVYFQSLPYDDRSGAPLHQRECSQLVSDIKYLHPRIASIFRAKIGVTANRQHLVDVAVLSAIELVNGYHFADAGIPPDGKLSIRGIRDAADKVALGLDNAQELVCLLRQFDKHLSRDGGWIHEAQLRVRQTLGVLERCIGVRPGN
ncbi:hypothetical protein [Stenotrophomonas sp. S39]|uniref:hypothetical protein n=1 Tax=Stenotrophomonas sp. S39 TaxID=2767451 RepID=UPI00190AD7F8|nr:hypothetical protein [Stenotrophomonas sp. S39]MBK0052756.1 hypothetical protein [Stenotrophomonas sp. S39]